MNIFEVLGKVLLIGLAILALPIILVLLVGAIGALLPVLFWIIIIGLPIAGIVLIVRWIVNRAR